MNGKQLKNSILQWAIQGKLVPQDPNDEPASVLLERIRSEKARLVKEGKIKKDKNESIIYKGDDNSYYEKFPDGKVVCIDEEIPFEIPKGWEWTRTVNVFDVWSARRVHEKDWRSSGIPFYRAREIGKLAEYGYVNNDLFIDETLYNEFSKSGLPYKNDLMVTAVGTIGKVYVVPDDKPFYYKDGSVLCFNNFGDLDPAFIKAVIESPMFVSQYGMESQGTTVATLTIIRVNQYLIPIPPISEQHRIVSCLRSVADAVEKYDKSQNSLNKLNAGIRSRLKASILQEAIQGKLMAQDPNDEPAEKLLEKISAEKQRFVKEGKLKAKDAITSVIFKGEDNKYYEKTGKGIVDITEEIPFEIPSNWCWTRASSIAQIIMGQSPDGESINSSNGIEFHQGKVHFTDKYLAVAPYFTSAPSKYAEPLSLLLCVRAPVGVANITERRICIGRGLCALNFYKGINLDLIFYFFATFKKYYEDLATGSTFKAISKDIVSDTLIPIPPEQEQIRIIEMIQSLYSKIA